MTQITKLGGRLNQLPVVSAEVSYGAGNKRVRALREIQHGDFQVASALTQYKPISYGQILYPSMLPRAQP